MPSVQLDAFIFQGSPQALDEDVVQISGLFVAQVVKGDAVAVAIGKLGVAVALARKSA